MSEKVFVHAGGKRRELVFGSRAIVELSKEFGNIGSIWSSLDPYKISKLLWAALLHKQRTLSHEQVVEWLPVNVGSDEMTEILEGLSRAFAISQGLDPDALDAGDEEEEAGN